MEPLVSILFKLRATIKQRSHSFLLTLLVLSVLINYANSLSVPFVMDDFVILNFGTQNLFDILLHGTVRRIVDFTLALNYQLHGAHVAGYHIVNIIIHLSASITLYFFIFASFSALRTSFPSKIDNDEVTRFCERFVPFATALLFAIHPIQTQAVTYIIQRYASMATLFYLLSSLFYVKARIAFETNKIVSKTIYFSVICIFAAIIAFGSKQISFTLPITLLMLEVFLFRGALLVNRKFLFVIGTIGIIVLSLSLFFWYEKSLNDVFFDLRHGTAENLYITRTSYLLTQCRVVMTYLRLLVLPINQSLFYDYPAYTSIFSLQVTMSLVGHILILFLMITLFKKSEINLQQGNRTDGSMQRLAAQGIVWFYITMAVESSVFPIRDVIFEHRVYLPSAGFFIVAAIGFAISVSKRIISEKIAWTLLTVIAVLLSSMTITRNHLWNNSLELWKDTVKKAPYQHLALSNLAIEHLERKNPIEAIPLFVRALEIRPQMDFRIKVYFGEALQESNLIDPTRFTTGLEYMLPDYSSSSYKASSVIFNNLGLAYEYMEQPEKAINAYTKSLGINPTYELAWYNKGLLLVKLGKRQEAEEIILKLESLHSKFSHELLLKVR